MGQVCSALFPNRGAVKQCFEVELGSTIATKNPSQVALIKIRSGHTALSSELLPQGAARELLMIEKSLLKLEHLLDKDAQKRSLLKLPFARPSLQEQSDWEALCPEGGSLLRRQVCVAAVGDRAVEWFMGCLYVSEAGLLFECESNCGLLNADDLTELFDSGYAQAPVEVLSSGLLRWDEIDSFEKIGVGSNSFDGCRTALPPSVTLGLHRASPNNTLHLQPGLSTDIIWLEQAWQSCREALPKRPVHASIISLDGKNEDAVSRASTGSTCAHPDQQIKGLQLMRRSAFFSATSFYADAAQLPAAKHPVKKTADFSKVFPAAKMNKLTAAMKSEKWPIHLFLEGYMECFNLVWTPWAESAHNVGSVVRRCRFVSPVPKDIPWAVAALIKLPKEAKATALYTMQLRDEDIVLVSQVCAHDVPFGEYFRSQQTNVFKAIPGGGVEMKVYTETMWLAPVASIIKFFVERKARSVEPIMAFAEIVDRVST